MMMKKMVWKYRMLVAILSCVFGFAINGTAQLAVTSASDAVSIDGNVYEYVIGEMVLVNTAATPEFVLTQGFLQPEETVIFSVAEAMNNLSMNVYPNPFRNTIQLELSGTDAGNYQVDMMDASGRIVKQWNLVFSGNGSYQTLDLSSFSTGCYFLKVTGNTTTENSTYITRILKN